MTAGEWKKVLDEATKRGFSSLLSAGLGEVLGGRRRGASGSGG